MRALPAAALGQWLIVFFYIIQREQIIGMMSFSQEILKIISLYLLPFSSKSRSKSQVVCSHTYCGCFQSSETNLPRAGNIRLYCAIFSQLCLKLGRPVRPVSSQPALAASLLGTVIHSPSLYCIVRALVCHILDRVCLGKKWLASSCQFLFSTTYLPLPIKLCKWVKIFKKIKYSNINYVLWNKKALTKGLSV